MSRGQKASTLLLYEGKWNVFGAWYSGRNVDPLHASKANIAYCLWFLKDVKGLCLSKMGLRYAIASTLHAVTGLEVGKAPSISSLLANFAQGLSKTAPD